jgi:hypothetical protein
MSEIHNVDKQDTTSYGHGSFIFQSSVGKLVPPIYFLVEANITQGRCVDMYH